MMAEGQPSRTIAYHLSNVLFTPFTIQDFTLADHGLADFLPWQRYMQT
jgi:hypothetical protein